MTKAKAKAKAKVPCPRCEQDWLQVVRLVNIGEKGVLCPECEAFWSEGTEPLYENFVDVMAFLKSNGYDDFKYRHDFRFIDEIDVLGPLRTS